MIKKFKNSAFSDGRGFLMPVFGNSPQNNSEGVI
jgi:hypothetical protein